MRMYYFVSLGVTALLLALPVSAAAKDKTPQPPPQAWQDLVKCKDIADPAARLACYDAEVGKVDTATQAGDMVIADRATMRETRKGLFGFRLPSLGLFGGGRDDDEDDKDEIKEIDTTVASARQFGYGLWRLTLADGSVWEQVDDKSLVKDPKSGSKVHIYKGALGSYNVNIDGQIAIKMRRVR